MIRLKEFVERTVPCDGCTLCCRGDAVFLHADYGDNIYSYKIEFLRGRPMLAHKPDGSCFYLGESGCTIHDRRPVACREFDCRAFVEKYSRSVIRRLQHQGALNADVLEQARKLLGRK